MNVNRPRWVDLGLIQIALGAAALFAIIPQLIPINDIATLLIFGAKFGFYASAGAALVLYVFYCLETLVIMYKSHAHGLQIAMVTCGFGLLGTSLLFLTFLLAALPRL
jgi:hypothetical protein